MTQPTGGSAPTQTEMIGRGAIARVREIIDAVRPATVFLVAGRTSFRESGAEAALTPLLAGTRVVRFAEFAANPRIEDVLAGAARFREADAGLVIAVGGGSAMDIAKSVRAFAGYEGPPLELLEGRVAPVGDGPPLVAIPTTSGSGAEATQFAVVYVDGVKYSLDHPSLRADYAVVDAALTDGLEPRMTAATGMDALAQGIESIWSVRASDASIADASEGVTLALRHLADAVNAPTTAARDGMATAAHASGRAIDRTRTTACHAISYPITSHFGVPHGHAVALTLPAMLVVNAAVGEDDCQDPRGVAAVRDRIAHILALLDVADAREGRERLLGLMRAIGLETSLAGLGITDRALIVREGFNPARMGNNPRRVTADALERILAGDDAA